MLGLPDSGSRTWMWQIAAPALAASMQSPAISAGVTGRVSLCWRVVWLPVTAQESIVGRMSGPRDGSGARAQAESSYVTKRVFSI